MATPAEVSKTVRDLIARLETSDAGSKSALGERTIACVITDHRATYKTAYKDGRMEALEVLDGNHEGDITFRVSSDDLVALAQGRLSILTALMMRRLQVDAGASDIAILRRMF